MWTNMAWCLIRHPSPTSLCCFALGYRCRICTFSHQDNAPHPWLYLLKCITSDFTITITRARIFGEGNPSDRDNFRTVRGM
ncbi:hypothetical protein PF005_g20031 [Phytophthora fragariae]|uniref:Secreted protein n=1 Tax=Phytophthora fragariae TaxID=53985 RepID=A0A6A3SI40_9STRA|nr:hypothetical protein PF009_g16479 [Phytophthora fragariae]KAE8992130.1 hypothetical protein PF011_g17663 [Phytophthora fragariae]KAE9088489.1 hypothetical protein PF007_g19952 [Phytophthora fragariae]KAE9090291.1 hypothetical protein PF010_g18647 [Phytophthora fragariae]KAE9117577.1 hypothetical protein PF006_g18781 [Phytophthora fragariae]